MNDRKPSYVRAPWYLQTHTSAVSQCLALRTLSCHSSRVQAAPHVPAECLQVPALCLQVPAARWRGVTRHPLVVEHAATSSAAAKSEFSSVAAESEKLEEKPPTTAAVEAYGVCDSTGLPRAKYRMVGKPLTSKRLPSSRCLSASTCAGSHRRKSAADDQQHECGGFKYRAVARRRPPACTAAQHKKLQVYMPAWVSKAQVIGPSGAAILVLLAVRTSNKPGQCSQPGGSRGDPADARTPAESPQGIRNRCGMELSPWQ